MTTPQQINAVNNVQFIGYLLGHPIMCIGCRRGFHSYRAVSSHKRWCKKKDLTKIMNHFMLIKVPKLCINIPSMKGSSSK